MYANYCFLDTGAWFSLLVPSDPDHEVIKQTLIDSRRRLITTDFVLDELLTLLRARDQGYRTAAAWDLLHSRELVYLVHLTEDDLTQAWEIFRRFDDKKWSFTDCTSKQVIDNLNIPAACSLDHHFRQFGEVQVIPPVLA